MRPVVYTDRDSADQWKSLAYAHNARSWDAFEPVFASDVAHAAQSGWMFVGTDAVFHARRHQFIALAARFLVPVVYEGREAVVTGGLMSYGPSLSDFYRQVGIYTGRILKGARAADLPVLQPTKFELVINLKTAKALGLTISPSLLGQAEQVIE